MANTPSTKKPTDPIPDPAPVIATEDVGEATDTMKTPSISILENTKVDSPETINVDLPQGILITGGVKLRDAGYTGKGVKVAVIDSGIDETHPGFNGKVTRKQWYRSGTPLSQDFHGTHVAGTVHLMAPDAEIYDYRVFGRTGSVSVDQAIVRAIDQARLDGSQVINMSLGGSFPNFAMRSAIRRAYDAGMIIVCAAGNSGDDNPLTNEVSYPASFGNCISVAAVQKEDGLPVATFSSSNDQVDYSGIGVNVLSLKPGGDVMRLSGTSMASPHVAGLVACVLSKELATDGPDDVIVTDPQPPDDAGSCWGLCSVPGDVKAKVIGGEFEGVDDDATLRTLLNNQLLVDIGITGPDNETGLGFLTYLNKEELDAVF